MAKYSKIAILFHWLIAILIAANILLANLGEDLPRAARAAYMSPHKAIGISILILTIGRILWRIANRPPALPDKVTGWQAKAGNAFDKTGQDEDQADQKGIKHVWQLSPARGLTLPITARPRAITT